MEQLLVTVEEAGRRLGISRSAAYLLIGAGTLTSVKLGRSRRVPAAAVDALVASLLEQAADQTAESA
jgi:excisionase family DNA binding protein